MLVLGDGRTIGTLGGGCVEAEVRKQALTLLSSDQSKLLEFRLDHDYGWDDGLICGGIMDIYVQIIDAGRAAPFRAMRDALAGSRGTQFHISYELAGSQKAYIEELGPPPMLLIAGAGHVGQCIGGLAPTLDFRVTVIDDRADYASPERFPSATRIVGDIETELRKIKIDPSTYIVVVTRGHSNDGHALEDVVNSWDEFFGIIG